MLKLVVGSKGKGKTKYMLEHANAEGIKSDGVVVYIDKNSDHMFQLDKSVRLINAREYPVNGLDNFLSFLCGLISGNHDIETIYLDSFLTLAFVDESILNDAVKKLLILTDVFKINIVASISTEESSLDEEFLKFVEHLA